MAMTGMQNAAVSLQQRDTLLGALDATATINTRLIELVEKAVGLADRLCGPTPAAEGDNTKGIPASSVPIIDALHGNQRTALRLLDELGVELNRIVGVIG